MMLKSKCDEVAKKTSPENFPEIVLVLWKSGYLSVQYIVIEEGKFKFKVHDSLKKSKEHA